MLRLTGGRLDQDFKRGVWTYHAPHKLVIRVSGERITRISVRDEMLAYLTSGYAAIRECSYAWHCTYNFVLVGPVLSISGLENAK